LGITKGNQKGLVLLFLGPSGCGKTELARRIAAKKGVGFVEISLNAVNSRAQLIGGPPGTVGQGEGILTGIYPRTLKQFDALDRRIEG